MRNSPLLIVLSLLYLLSACGNNEEQWIADHGYGPVTEELNLGEINTAFAFKGKQIFDTFCVACHSINAQISGPALRGVVDNRSPEFAVNYILNPRENSEKHPVGQELSGQFSGIMPDMRLDKEEALAVYEYMRYYNKYREDPEPGN